LCFLCYKDHPQCRPQPHPILCFFILHLGELFCALFEGARVRFNGSCRTSSARMGWSGMRRSPPPSRPDRPPWIPWTKVVGWGGNVGPRPTFPPLGAKKLAIPFTIQGALKFAPGVKQLPSSRVSTVLHIFQEFDRLLPPPNFSFQLFFLR